MPSKINAHVFLDWAKARIDEIDDALASLEKSGKELQAKSGPEAEKLVEELRRSREQFWKQARAHADATEAVCRQAADRIQEAAKKFAADHRSDMDAVAARMKAGASETQAQIKDRVQDLHRAAIDRWRAFDAALGDARTAFERACQAARESSKRHAKPSA